MRRLLALLLFAPARSRAAQARPTCFRPDLLSKDAEWFSRPGRLFIRNVSIETPPLTPNKPMTADDLVSADGLCPGMAPPGAPADANASADGAAAAPPPRPTGRWRLVIPNATSCAASARPTASTSPTIARGDRVAVINYSRGQRAGIYTFTAGRLTSIERGPESVAPPKAAKPKPRKKPAAT